VRARFLEGHFQLPARHEPLDDLGWRSLEVGAQQRLGLELAIGVGDEHPTDGDRRQATVIPDRCCRCQPHGARCAGVPAHRGVLPVRRGVAEPGRRGGLTCAHLAWSPALTGRRRGWVGQGRIQAQARDQVDRLRPALTGGQQLERSGGTVGHDHPQAFGQPLLRLGDHLARPIGELLVRRAALLVGALGRRQDGQKGPGPHALGPRKKTPIPFWATPCVWHVA